MKKTLSIVLTLLFSVMSIAQNNYQPGSYISEANNTKNGLVKVLSNERIAFKTNSEDAEKILFASAIKGYSLDDPAKEFISLKDEDNKTQFYEYIVKSEIALLLLDDTYYILDKTNGLKKLEIKKIQKSTDQGAYESTINSYIGVLSYYAKDCQELQSEVNSVSYNRKSLSNFVVKLNECLNNDITDYSKETAVNLLELGVTVGGNFANFENTDVGGYKTSGPSLGLGVGAFVSYSPDITKYNLSFILGVEYNQKKVDYTYDEPNFPSERNFIHDASVLEPYFLALYQPFYNKQGLLSPYIGLGTSYGFTLSHNIEERDIIAENIYERDLDQSFSLLFKVGSFITVKNQKFLMEIALSDYGYQDPAEPVNYGSNFQIKVGYVIQLN